MSKVEFRSKGTYYDAPQQIEDQLELPISVATKREVWWINGYTEVQKRFFRQKAVVKLVIESGVAQTTYLDANHISELEDPNLRYALRFADAAEAVGMSDDGNYGKSGHFVTVVATSEDVKSKFLNATYSGITSRTEDTFMQSLRDVGN